MKILFHRPFIFPTKKGRVLKRLIFYAHTQRGVKCLAARFQLCSEINVHVSGDTAPSLGRRVVYSYFTRFLCSIKCKRGLRMLIVM
jgi:hypothetical protein